MNQKDYYEVLGLERTAAAQQIKEAYRKLAFQYHPDRNKGDAAAVEKMKEINEAYAVLSDPEKRSRYDAMRQQYGSYAYDRFRQRYSDQDIFRGSDINQIFEEMAKAFGFRGFEEVFRESYGRGYRTSEFRGPGMFGKVIIFGPGYRNRKAENEVRGAETEKPGIVGRAINRLVQYAVKKMLGTAGTGNRDVYDAISLNEQEARRGGKVVYMDEKRSRQLSVTIPPGIKEGQLIRLRGMGDGGDLYLKVEIKRPILEKVKKLLKI